jgi:putative nucleotidyltransferase with HDIG domain
MELKLSRDVAYDLVVKNIGVNNLLKHILAVEVGMRALADHLGEDAEYWGLVGLVHDLDYNQTKDDAPQHTYITKELLAEYELPEAMWYAIHAHPGHLPCKSHLDWALYSVDPTTGFIVACALMHPEKKLSVLTPEFMLRRFGEKRFAAGATRENIAACAKLGIELDQFLVLVRDAMIKISGELGL